MRRSLLVAMLCPALVASTVSVATAQRTRGRTGGGIPTDVTSAIAALYNAPDTHRERGAVSIGRDSVVQGSLAVRDGPVTLAGRVTGSLVVINSDVTFESGAKVDGEVFIVGGKVEGRERATIGADFKAYAEALRYRMGSNDALIIDESRMENLITNDDDGFWQHRRTDRGVQFNLVGINGANTYNRVEGLPILIGPRLRVQRDWGTFLLQGRGIVRTAEPIEWDRGSIGHDARAEVRFGYRGGIGFGATAVDRIDPVENWQLGDKEAGLTAVAVHRDYRDYFSRHGATGFVKVYVAQDASLTFGYTEEHWESRDARHPWSLFRDDEGWRPNPVVDDGHARLNTVALNIDQRANRYSMGAGWYVHADVERGHFEPTLFASDDPATAGPAREYTRGFLDLRRYNRLAPHAQLNLRFVTGGWLAGDELPLERRLSASGPGVLPGFDFRSTSISGEDRMQCSEVGGPLLGVPALCDRVALLQVEYRGDLAWHVRGDDHWWKSDFHAPAWSVFFDAGRGWRAKDDGVTTYAIQSFPDISTFKTDAGIGLDLGSASVSVAKSISDRKEPLNWVVRLSRRF